jgi:hypothetical protein
MTRRPPRSNCSVRIESIYSAIHPVTSRSDLIQFGNWSGKKSARKSARNYKTDDSILLDVSPWNLQNKPDLWMCRRITGNHFDQRADLCNNYRLSGRLHGEVATLPHFKRMSSPEAGVRLDHCRNACATFSTYSLSGEVV